MGAMELKQERRTFDCLKTVLEESIEQSVEKDFVLPDYCPDIFRILKCRAIPKILSHGVSGGKLSFELAVNLKILYESEGSERLGFIEQKLQYTKSIELPKDTGSDTDIRLTPVCDYINCRVVNKRRIDVRGAVTTKAEVRAREQRSLMTDAAGAGVQLKKQVVTYPAKRICAAKRITIVEEFELGPSKPAPSAMIRCDCAVIKGEQKIIANKLLAKGDAEITMLYTCVTPQGTDSCESMKFTIPFSQIVDVDGIDDSFETAVDIRCSSCEVMAKGDESGTLEGEVVLLVNINAVKYETAQAVTDAYSTKYECSLSKESTRIESAPVGIDETLSKSAVISNGDESIGTVYDTWGELYGVSARFDDEKSEYVISGNLRFCLLGRNESGKPLYLEQEEPFEHSLGKGLACSSQSRICIDAFVRSVSYRLGDGDSAELSAQIVLTGQLYDCTEEELVTDISPDTDRPRRRESDCAVKLCRCNESTDIWELAKKYGTSVEGIEQENELTGTMPAGGSMLLIPLIG